MSRAGSSVSRRGLPPAAPTKHTSSALPSIRQVYAICRPSGDQDGASGAAATAKSDALAPSRSDTHTARRPDRLDKKAIWFPSGEYCGLRSSAVEEISRTGVSRPETGTRQISPSHAKLEYTRRSPCGEIDKCWPSAPIDGTGSSFRSPRTGTRQRVRSSPSATTQNSAAPSPDHIGFQHGGVSSGWRAPDDSPFWAILRSTGL